MHRIQAPRCTIASERCEAYLDTLPRLSMRKIAPQSVSALCIICEVTPDCSLEADAGTLADVSASGTGCLAALSSGLGLGIGPSAAAIAGAVFFFRAMLAA